MNARRNESKKDEVLRLLVQHKTMLSAYLWTVAEDWHVVDDAFQDTAIYVSNHWQDYELGTNFGAWARAVALNCCRAILTKKQRFEKRHVPLTDALCETIPDRTWDQTDCGADRMEAFHVCFKKLTDFQRCIFTMFHADDRNCDDIAATTKKNIGTIYKVLSHVRRGLRLCIEDYLEGKKA